MAIDLVECDVGGEPYLLVGPKKYCVPKIYQNCEHIYKSFQPRANDIWMFGYLRSGTTMAQEMIWLIANDLNFEAARNEILDFRFAFFDNILFMNAYNDMNTELTDELLLPAWQRLEATSKRRFIKTHMAPSLLNPMIFNGEQKIVYACRNPKNVIVSSYYMMRSFIGYTTHHLTTFRKHWDQFKAGHTIWTPYFEHLKEGWRMRNQHNVLFLVYEEVIKDLPATIQRVADFLDKPSLGAIQVQQLVDHLQIDNFRSNSSVNNDHLIEMGTMRKVEDNHHFIRTGGNDSWRGHFVADMAIEVDEWIRSNLQDCLELLQFFRDMKYM